MTKVLCIVRSSTVAQEIETQKKELIEFARTNGYNDDDISLFLPEDLRECEFECVNGSHDCEYLKNLKIDK